MKQVKMDMHSVPVLPELANSVLRMILEDKEVSVFRLSSLIEKDQGLTSRILSVANSSYYRRSRTIYTVRDAIVVMGLDTVKTVTMGLCVLDMFPPAKGSRLNYKAFWRHSIACAIFAKSMMSSIDESLADKAFFAGLLHDIGKLVLDQAQPKKYAEVLDAARDGKKPLINLEQEMLSTTHADVGRSILERWKLPRVYVESVWCHHAPVKILDDNQYRISGIVHIANILSHMSYMGSSGNEFPQRISNPLLKRFDVKPELLDSLMVDVPREIDSICIDVGIGKPTEGLFTLVNKASMRLADMTLRLRRETDQLENEKGRTSLLIDVLGALNRSSKISEALESSSGILLGSGLVKSFLAGIKLKGSIFVYEQKQGEAGRFLQVGEEELKTLILSGKYTTGTTYPSGAFAYMEMAQDALLMDRSLVNALIEGVTSSLVRISSENAREEQEIQLRDALYSVSIERQRAEDALGLNRELMDASLVGLCLLDDKGFVEVENKTSREIRDTLGIGVKDFSSALANLSKAPATKIRDAIRSRHEVDLRWEHDSGIYRFMVRPLKVNMCVLVMMWDITKDVEQEEKLLAYSKMSAIGNLAASMAHNMKSPLGAIQGFARIMKDDITSGRVEVLREGARDEDFAGMVDSVLKGSENVLSMINQLLDLTRKKDAPAEDTDLSLLVDEVFTVVKSQADASGVLLVKDVRVPRAKIRQQAVRQVIMALVLNAISASKAGQEVIVRIDEGDDKGLVITVKDLGMGMTRAEISKIFDPLYTNWPSRTGLGMGLALVMDIVKSLEGRIWVDSELGKGSEFHVFIPKVV